MNRPVELIPLTDSGDRQIMPSVQVECRDVSMSGVGLRHKEPLTYRTVGLAMPNGGDPEAVWVTRLKWCRFTSNGFYESGGIFLRVIPRKSLDDAGILPECEPADFCESTSQG